MKIRKCGEIRKDFKIEKLERKIEVINIELNNICSNISIALNTNEQINIKDIEQQIREIQDFMAY